jgi:hypothetical protein
VRKYLFSAGLLVAGTIAGPAVGETFDAATHGSQADIATALDAVGPHSSIVREATAFTRLIGTWDVKYTDFTKAGKALHRTGKLHFGWVMDGRVLQDLWVVDASGTSKEREVYTDLFYFDPKARTWHDAFVDPHAATVATFVGGPIGSSQIVMESHDLDPAETHRWSFNDISSNSLVFRDEASSDNGKTWTLKSEYDMKRLN